MQQETPPRQYNTSCRINISYPILKGIPAMPIFFAGELGSNIDGVTMRNQQLLHRADDYLFSGTNMHEIRQAQERAAGDAASRMSDDRLLNTPTDDLVEEIVRQFGLNIPVLDRD